MSAPQLRIRLLGPLEVLEGDERLDLPPSRKARALLAYLAATARPHARSALCDLFWQDVNDPRAGLRWALSKLRTVVDGDQRQAILSARNRIQLDTEAVSVDLHSVRGLVADDPEAASTEALREAAGAFRGDFVEGLDLPGCHQYEAWCLGTRERLRSLHLSIHATLVDRLRGDPQQALSHALTRLTLDPYGEAGYVMAMELLADLGRTEKGLELYDRCRRMLSEYMGVAPSEELESARRRLKSAPRPENRVERAGDGAYDGPDGLVQLLGALPEPEHLPSPGESDPPLVGREDQVRELVEIVQQSVSDGGGAAVLVTGEAGIGKTRLLRELARRVRSTEGWALSGPVFESEEVRPYGPWADMLRQLPREALDGETRRRLSGLLETPGSEPRGGGPAERIQLFDAAGQLLRELAEAKAPALVALDDVQWLDPSSTALLHYLIRTLTSVPLVFALAARDGEVDPGSAVAAMLRSLDGAGHLLRIHLERLGVSDTEALVRAVDRAVDPGPVFAASEGNPLFALAVAASHRDGVHRTPASIEEELHDRLERLETGARSLLPWAAALGRAFDVPTLVRVVEKPVSEIVEAIAVLERRGILRAAGTDRYDFAHDLLRQVAYRRSSEPVRRQIHRSIAGALDEMGPDEGRMPGAVAHHAEQGGLPALGAGAYAEAAERSLWVFAFDEAATMVERVLALVEGLPDDARIPLEMDLLRIYSFRSMRDRRPEELEARVGRIVDEARDRQMTGVVAVGHAVAMELQYQRGAFKEAKQSSLQYADAGRESGPATAVRALAETATCLLLLDQAPEDARRLASEALSLSQEHGFKMEATALSQALLNHHDGDLEGASRAFEEVVRLGRETNDRWWECPAMTRMIMVDLDRSNPERALARSRQAQALAERMDHPTEAVFARGLGAIAAERAGMGGEQEKGGSGDLEAVDEALKELRNLDSLWKIAHVQAYAAELDLEEKRVKAARQRAEEVLEAARTLKRPSLLALGQALLAQCLALEEDQAAAREQLGSPEIRRPDHGLSHRAREAVERAREVTGVGSSR